MVKITEKKAKKYTFSDVDDYEVFCHIGKMYMKLPKIVEYPNQKTYNAICFDTSKYQFFSDGDHIFKYETEIILTKVL